MNVVPIEKLQMDLSIGIEKRDRLILNSVLVAAGEGALTSQKEKARGNYLAVGEAAEKALNRLEVCDIAR